MKKRLQTVFSDEIRYTPGGIYESDMERKAAHQLRCSAKF